MKKLLFILALFAATISIQAQSTVPRFGTTTNQDNTSRSLTYSYQSITDATGADSAIIVPSAYQSIYAVTLKDSLTLSQPVITNCYAGDRITIIASAPSGTPFLKFYGTDWISQGKATLSTSLRAVIQFVFDGAKWVEVSRVVQ